MNERNILLFPYPDRNCNAMQQTKSPLNNIFILYFFFFKKGRKVTLKSIQKKTKQIQYRNQIKLCLVISLLLKVLSSPQ